MNTIRTISRFGSIVCLLNAMFWISTAHAQQLPSIPATDRIRLAEAFRLASAALR